MISLRNVSKRFPHSSSPAVRDLSLDVDRGETVFLVGPSGCGKTTTLRMINRLIEPSSGSILVDGKDVLRQEPAELRRGMGYVIQSIGLLPHRTVAKNIATVPALLGWEARRIRDRGRCSSSSTLRLRARQTQSRRRRSGEATSVLGKLLRQRGITLLEYSAANDQKRPGGHA